MRSHGIARFLVPVVVLFALGAGALAQLSVNPSRERRDVSQERLDTATPPLESGMLVGQTFLSRHANLVAIELLLVRFKPETEIDPSAKLILTLEHLGHPDTPTEPVTSELSASSLQHNQRIRFSFSPQPNSENAHYLFTVQCERASTLGVWSAGDDAYAQGKKWWNGSAGEGDLVFSTHYKYHLSDALVDAERALSRYAGQVPALFVLLFMPGLALLLWVPAPRRLDLGTFLALSLALSMAFWPLLLLWGTVVGARLSSGGTSLVVVLLPIAGLYRLWATRGAALLDWLAEDADVLPEITLALVLLIALGTRLLQVRELVVPAWVDSVHHSLIAQIISETGKVPSSLEPYLPITDFHYHFGFHANAAALMWLTGLPTHQAVLLLGQILNALAALCAYAFASLWSRRRWAGVSAAAVVGLVSYMPAYYVSWGRYTQLAGMLLLALACPVSAWLLSSRRRPAGVWVLAITLVAGLALIHYRVLILYAAFWASYPLLHLWRRRGEPQAWLGLAMTGIAVALGSLLVIAPWALHLVARIIPMVGTTYGGWGAPEALDTSFPTGLLNVGWTPKLLWVAGAAAVWASLRKRGELMLIPLWAALCLLLANLHVLGLPDLWLITNTSVFIAYWLPVGALCGWLAADVFELLAAGLRRVWPGAAWGTSRSWLLLGAIVALAAWRSWHMVDVINPVTVMVTDADMEAITWVEENTPQDALLLNNSRVWQGELRVGNDGGYWLPILARRRVTQPCVLYAQGSVAYRDAVNDLARAVEDAESLDDPVLIERLVQARVTHVFVGERGGRLEPKTFDGSPFYELLYSYGPARVYAFTPESLGGPS